MEFTNEEMVKSLTSLIDETLEEIEEIKKSKFAASEISLGDDKSGISDKSKNGKLEAKKAEDEDEDEDEEDDDMDKADCMDKAEDDMDKADCMDKAEDEDEEDEEDEDEEDKKHEKKEKEMKKSLIDSQELMKSYVDSRISDLEKTISRLVNVVESIADAPVQRKGIPAGVAPLHKSTEELEPLSKSQVANQLFELKKSGKQVDSADIFKVETGNNLTVLEIANKYGLR